ncbi:type II toxin-antitoxin system VapC family toxin [Methylomagnum sp.]
MQTVYLETPFISYLTARPSRTIVGAAHQQVTRDWWERERFKYDLRVSELVLLECSKGDAEAAQQRLEITEGIPRLEIGNTVRDVARDLVQRGFIPAKVAEDALHIAIAAAHGIDFILTWNFKHIVNPIIQAHIAECLLQWNLTIPFICTPEELLGEDSGVIH